MLLILRKLLWMTPAQSRQSGVALDGAYSTRNMQCMRSSRSEDRGKRRETERERRKERDEREEKEDEHPLEMAHPAELSGATSRLLLGRVALRNRSWGGSKMDGRVRARSVRRAAAANGVA